MKRTLLLAITALVAFGLLAPAANAGVNGTGVIPVGTAEVGRHFVDRFNGAQIDCRKETVKSAVARGQGLFLPGVAPTTNGVWSLHTNITFVGTNNQAQPVNGPGTLDACGWLQHVGKVAAGTAVGPACGVSKGHSGRGQVNFTEPPFGGVNLFDLGWKTSAGGTLPVTGKYQAWDGMKPNKHKKPKWGNILAQVQAQGGAGPCTQEKNCTNQKKAAPNTAGCGAQIFNVVGTFEAVQTGTSKDSVVRPKTAPPACKSTANALCAYDDNKFGKEPRPAFKTD